MKEKYFRQISSSFNSLTEISDDELRKFTDKLRRKKMKKGEFFTKSGGELKNMAYVISGLFRCYGLDERGNEFTKHFFCEDDLIISHSAFCNLKLGVNNCIVAEEDSVIFVTKVANLNELFESHPCWHMLAKKILERHKRIEEKRVSSFLLKSDVQRYNEFLQDFPGIEKRVKKEHIASYLGISPDLIGKR
jgi:CRP-like cAMP-binding protein